MFPFAYAPFPAAHPSHEGAASTKGCQGIMSPGSTRRIGKTRQPETRAVAPQIKRPRLTLLNSAALSEHCRRSHFLPSPDLAPFVSVAWTLQWNLAAHEAFVQRVLPDPCVQIVVKPGGAHVLGVVTGAYSARLKGEGFVLGLKFRPGGLYPFTRQPVSGLTDRKARLAAIFAGANQKRLKDLAAAADGRGVFDALECLLREAGPRVDSGFAEIQRITGGIASDPSILTVEDVAARLARSPRTLQRLFRTYVGVSPKWIIRRYRIQEAAARVEAGGIENWAGLAQRLGYFDQAHFINEFRSLIGRPPGDYANSIQNRTDT